VCIILHKKVPGLQDELKKICPQRIGKGKRRCEKKETLNGIRTKETTKYRIKNVEKEKNKTERYGEMIHSHYESGWL
jgi:hypothetical protein